MTETFVDKKSVAIPAGKAHFCHLITPDEYKGKLEYKFGVILDLADPKVAEFKDRLDATCIEVHAEGVKFLESGGGKVKPVEIAKAKKAAEKLEVHYPYQLDYDQDTGEETGCIVLKAKSQAQGNKKDGSFWKRKLPLFDCGAPATEHTPAIKPRNITGKVERIFGGSTLIGDLKCGYFTSEGLGKSGVSFQINAVQIVELSSGSSGGNFGVEEGGFDGASLQDVDTTMPDAEGDKGQESGGYDGAAAGDF